MGHKAFGILGGAFDPIHNGHLRLAIEVREKLHLDEVRLIPACESPVGKNISTIQGCRLKMVQLAVEDIDGLIGDDRELRRGGVSYTIDTVRSLRDELNETPIMLIIGMDAFQSLPTWKEWHSITDYTHIVIANRHGNQPKIINHELLQFYEQRKCKSLQQLKKSSSGKVFMIDIPMLEISSTHIRHQLSQHLDVRYLLPDAVIDYIKKESLYQ